MFSICVHYILQAAANVKKPFEKFEFEDLFKRVKNPIARKEVKTFIDVLIDEALDKGRNEGEIKGEIKSLLKFLEMKFPNKSASVEKKIWQISNSNDLTILSQIIFNAQDFSEVTQGIKDILAKGLRPKTSPNKTVRRSKRSALQMA